MALDRYVQDQARDDNNHNGCRTQRRDDESEQDQRPGNTDAGKSKACVVRRPACAAVSAPARPTNPNNPIMLTVKENGGALSRNVSEVQNMVNTPNELPPRTNPHRTDRSRLMIVNTEASRAG